MSDVGWGSDHLEPPKKRRIPLWIMGCAGGCMFAIGAAAVATYYGSTKFKSWLEVQTNPEVQWPRLAAVLPFDEQPAEFTIASWPIPMIDLWQLDSKTQDLVVYVFAATDAGNGGIWGEWLASPKEAPMFASQQGEFDTTEGRLMLQGRELRSVRFTRKGLAEPQDPLQPPDAPEEPPEPFRSGSHGLTEMIVRNESIRGGGLALDLTPESSPRRVLVWLVRGTAGATVSDEEAKAILAPFKIGPAR